MGLCNVTMVYWDGRVVYLFCVLFSIQSKLEGLNIVKVFEIELNHGTSMMELTYIASSFAVNALVAFPNISRIS